MTMQQTECLPAEFSQSSFDEAIVRATLHLKDHGWAIVENVLTREECNEYIDSVWKWLEGLGSGIKRDDPKTWTQPHWPDTHKGIFNILEVAHQDFVWRVRKHPRLLHVFETLYGTNELLSSFDSINALPPSKLVPVDRTSWLHTDQAPLRRGFFCVQGLVNMVDVSPETTGTLLVKDRSHNEHARFFETACTLSQQAQAQCKDHYKLKEEELSFFDPYPSLGLSGPAGSLFLWDSRTIHANVLPEAGEGWRHVVYTCYQPRSLATDADLANKRAAWDNFDVTTHWPAANVSVHDTFENKELGKKYNLPRTRGAVEDSTLRQLAGVEEYSTSGIRRANPLLDLSDQELGALLNTS